MGGCIVGDCPHCNELVYENEWDGEILEDHEEFIHERCAEEYLETLYKKREIKDMEDFIKHQGLLQKFYDYQERKHTRKKQATLF